MPQDASADLFRIAPIQKASGTVRLPGSKSISNRALLLAALCREKTRLTGLLKAEDTERMLQALSQLGLNIREEDSAVSITQEADFPKQQATIFVGNAGTVARMLTAALAFAGGEYQLDGVKRMRERPIGDLVDALCSLGARIDYLGTPGCLPLAIHRADLSGNRVSVKGNVSSQFLTALLIMSPVWACEHGRQTGRDEPFFIGIDGELISRPYVEMTIKMMRHFGAVVEEGSSGYVVKPIAYRSPLEYAVEGDASAASYFLALGALAGGPIRVEGVGRNSLQGDVQFAEALKIMGASVDVGDGFIEVLRSPDKKLSGLNYDCLSIPDAAMTFVPMALSTQGSIELRGIASWRVKETDRLQAMVQEIRKFGASVWFDSDWIRVERGPKLYPARVATYSDHRMAMSFALAACSGVSVEIENPACTAKTFPNYFETLSSLIK